MSTPLPRSCLSWLLFKPNSAARLRVFCFPYASGGASVFRDWPNEVPAGVEVCPVQLPGRESRRQERAFERVEPLVAALADGLEPLCDGPFAFFGHSMGALIGFELSRELRRRGRRLPLHLFASGHRAPQLPDPDPPMHNLPEPELLARMAELNGTPREILENRDLMSLFLPLMRSDAAVCETYQYTAEPPLGVPLSAYGGTADPKVSREEIAAWRDQTDRGFECHLFPGDHFFLHTNRSQFFRVFTEGLRQTLKHV